MRAVVLVILMTVMALATGLSFVLRAAAQGQASAEMEFGCGPGPVVAPAEPTLLSCTAVARNTGSVTLTGAQLEFMPGATLPPPDFYLFWSEAHDGVRSVPGEAQLTYDFGDIPPGASSVIALEIIVRSTHNFGADVALVAEPNQREYSRTPIRGTVAPDGGAAVPVKLVRESSATAPTTSATYLLAITNLGQTPYDSVTAELSPGTDVLVKSDEWKASGLPGRVTVDFGPLGANSDIRRALTLAPATQGCATVHPVIVVTVVQGGVTKRQPAVDDGVLLGSCAGQPGGAVALPYGGSGPSRGNSRVPLEATTLATIGFLCVAMGATTCRRSRSAESTDRLPRRWIRHWRGLHRAR